MYMVIGQNGTQQNGTDTIAQKKTALKNIDKTLQNYWQNSADETVQMIGVDKNWHGIN